MVVYSILGEGRSPSGSIINYPHRWRGDEGWIERVLFGPRFEKLSLRGWICFCFGKRNFGLGSGLERFGGEGRVFGFVDLDRNPWLFHVVYLLLFGIL